MKINGNNASMKSAATALSEIRLLCTQGLATQVVVPAVARVMHRWIPNGLTYFQWVDARLQPTVAYFDLPEAAGCYQRYRDHYCNAREAEAQPTLQQVMLAPCPVENTDRYGKRFRESTFVRETLSPLQINTYVRAPVRIPKLGGGVLVLMRGPRDQPFALKEEQGLASAVSYLRHAFETPARPVEAYASSSEEGLVVLDRQGHIRHWTARAAFLSYLMVGKEVGERQTRPAEITHLLAGLAQALQDPHRPLPVRVMVNAWGRFCLRAYWLEPASDGEHHIGVTVRLQAPLIAGLIRAMDGWPLSPRHKELCLCLVRGLSYREAAQAMNVRIPTVVGYAQEIFTRLGVHGREGLLQRLLAPDEG